VNKVMNPRVQKEVSRQVWSNHQFFYYVTSYTCLKANDTVEGNTKFTYIECVKTSDPI
jgi:hypothetical protein